ncbi:MAG: HEAT repeat domain-containing protein [Planctomycetota bacterium]
MFIDKNKELVELLDRFVAMKFCETDEPHDYYAAAGYFISQWYWQPVLSVAYPDGREINIHWRHTHESFPVETVVDIMKKALAITGEGIDPDLAKECRASLNEAEDCLTLQDYSKAVDLARKVREKVDRGRLLEDAENIEREATFLLKAKSLADALTPRAEASEPFLAMLDALNYCLIRDYAEALPMLADLEKKGGEYGKKSSQLRPEIEAILSGALEVSRVAVGRYRIGPDIYHDIRAQVRSRLEIVEEAVLQYYARLKDGTVYAAFEGHGEVERGDNHRSSAFLPYAEVPSLDSISDVRVELWVKDRLVSASNLRSPLKDDGWWKKMTVRTLLLDAGRRSSWKTRNLSKTTREGIRLGGKCEVSNVEHDEKPVLAELRKIYKVLDWKMFTTEARIASLRLTAMGTKAVPHLVPLAYRYGAITTLQILPSLAKIPHEDAAGAVIHNLGADDVTLKGPAYNLLGWLEGQEYAPTEEAVSYLDSRDDVLRRMGAVALGVLGKKEGFLPLVSYLRSQDPGSKGAARAVSALKKLTCIDFGIDPDSPLSDQGGSVKNLLAWWKEFAETAPRAQWIARALEEMGFGTKGTLVKAVEAGDRAILEKAVKKALADDRGLARRAALLLAKDLRLRSLEPLVFDKFKTLGSRSPELGITRNTLRAVMTLDTISKLVDQIGPRGNGALALDFLLVTTGQYVLYPSSGRRMSSSAWESLKTRWRNWLEKNRDDLEWNPAEGRFESGK